MSQNIQVSPAVLNAAQKDGEDLLKPLRTTAAGLTQTEAEDRARTTGPNEVAQEHRQGWPDHLLKIIRNPLVILLATLSAISSATGDARAGTVMAVMVALSVALRFMQEARADAAAAKLKAMIHVTATVIRDGAAREMPLRGLVPPGYYQPVRRRHDSGRRAGALRQRPLRQPGEPYRRVIPSREVPRRRCQGRDLTDRD
jgi:Mg2+-importing ATPase